MGSKKRAKARTTNFRSLFRAIKALREDCSGQSIRMTIPASGLDSKRQELVVRPSYSSRTGRRCLATRLQRNPARKPVRRHSKAGRVVCRIRSSCATPAVSCKNQSVPFGQREIKTSRSCSVSPAAPANCRTSLREEPRTSTQRIRS